MSTKRKNVGRKPMRKCVCCEKEHPKNEMYRVVVSGRNTEVQDSYVDETGRQHGRGAYICRNVACINKAAEEGLITEEIRDQIMRELEDSSLKLLSLVMKSGGLAAGEYSAEESIKTGTAQFVIIAADA